MAKVGSKPVTTAQLQAVLTAARKQYGGPAFPARGTAEYRLVQEQAIDYLVQQSLAHQVDAELGIKPEDRVVTHASWRKVVSGIRVTDAQVSAVFAKNPKHYKLPGSNRTLDRGAAGEIRSELLTKERGAAMHRFIAAAEKRWPVTYVPAYRPVSEMALARRVWSAPPQKACDLPAGSYLYAKARAHGCLSTVPIPGIEAPACSLLGPEGDAGFSSAEENDGYADYLGDNGGTCIPDPRTQAVQVEPELPPNHKPVSVSYVHASGMAMYKHPLIEFTLRYPRRFHVQQVSYGGVESTDGVEVANYPLGPATSRRPLSRGAVELTFTAEGVGATTSSWPPTSSRHKLTVAKLPLKITDAELASGRYQTDVWADGVSLTLSITTGSSPSRQDLDALRAIAASIKFPPLRIGKFTPSNRYVLGRASSYPLGSVTEIAAGLRLPYYRKLRSGRFYLEHTADGFWQITWPGNLLHGYKACGPHWDATHRRFMCPSGAVWDIQGQVVKNPDPARDQDDPLDRQPAPVAGGDVLVDLQQSPR